MRNTTSHLGKEASASGAKTQTHSGAKSSFLRNGRFNNRLAAQDAFRNYFRAQTLDYFCLRSFHFETMNDNISDLESVEDSPARKRICLANLEQLVLSNDPDEIRAEIREVRDELEHFRVQVSKRLKKWELLEEQLHKKTMEPGSTPFWAGNRFREFRVAQDTEYWIEVIDGVDYATK